MTCLTLSSVSFSSMTRIIVDEPSNDGHLKKKKKRKKKKKKKEKKEEKKTRMYRPGHAGVKGNDREYTLAGKATLTNGLLLGRSEVLRSLRHYMREQSQGHHTIDRLEERGVERGSAR